MSQSAAQPAAPVMPDELLYGVDGPVATVTLNAPQRMNTISGPMLRQLSRALVQAAEGREVWAIVDRPCVLHRPEPRGAKQGHRQPLGRLGRHANQHRAAVLGTVVRRIRAALDRLGIGMAAAASNVAAHRPRLAHFQLFLKMREARLMNANWST